MNRNQIVSHIGQSLSLLRHENLNHLPFVNRMLHSDAVDVQHTSSGASALTYAAIYDTHTFEMLQLIFARDCQFRLEI